MKRSVNYIILLTLSVFGFQATSPDKKIAFITGTYGIDVPGTQILLHLKADHTFHYIDKEVKDRSMDINGKWSRQGNIIVLEDYDADRAIHKRWKIDADYPCLKSRRALEWRRLCLLKTE